MLTRVSIFLLGFSVGWVGTRLIIDLSLQHGPTVVDYVFVGVGLNALYGCIYSFTRNN